MERINQGVFNHLYELGVEKDGKVFRIEVLANTSTQACSIAKKQGYVGHDVNMVG